MDEAGALFAEGKAAMFMHGSWAISIFPESLQEQIGLFHFPYLWGMESQAIAAGYTSGIGISASVAGGAGGCAGAAEGALFDGSAAADCV